jgi:hypothetical protein
MSDSDLEEVINQAVQKERRLVTVEMEIKTIKDSMNQGFQEIRRMMAWGMTLIGGTLAALEIILRMVGK